MGAVREEVRLLRLRPHRPPGQRGEAGREVGRSGAEQIGYSTQILFPFRAALLYDGERLGRNEVEITKENDYGLLYLPQPQLRGRVSHL